MKKTGFRMLLGLLSAMLLFALTGCGASNKGTTAAPAATGSGALAAKLVWGGAAKSTAKTAALVPAGVTKVRLTVTGAGVPVVRNELTVVGGTTGQGQVGGIYPGSVSLVVQALNGSGAVLYEGFALNVPIVNGQTTDVGTITMTVPTVKAAETQCLGCHETTIDVNGQNLIADYKQSGHYTNVGFTDLNGVGASCAGCHGANHNTPNPAASGRCAECHNNLSVTHAGVANNACLSCHQPHNNKISCIGCHSIGQDANAFGSYVNDNNGVRAVVSEFSRTSHHVTGKVLTDADCAVCHMEGFADGSVNISYHMKDAATHLRNCNTSIQDPAAEYVWDPANPNHTAMDKFCMSCHNSQGAKSVPAAIFSQLGNGASATNPFGDTIANSYDGMSRSVVTPVYDQFDTNNSSHHAVRGKKYSGRTRETVTNPAGFTQYSGAAVNPTTATNTNGNAGIGPLSPGSRYTIYEAGYFVSNYTPLGAAATVADDSTLHCGDCHTVGQWKKGSTTAVTSNGDGSTSVVTGLLPIGAHGSNNEYLLRTSDGVDALHHQSTNVVQESALATDPHGTGFVAPTDGTYVCFLCHSQRVYAAQEYLPFSAKATATYANTRLGGHGGLHPCNDGELAESVGLVGSARVKTDTTDGEYGGGNLYGYTCAHCHNAGNKGFGGIHGGNAVWGTYSTNGSYASATNTGATVTYRKSFRFMGGLSMRYNGGATAAKWESQVLQKTNREGCYNFAISNKSSGGVAKPLAATANEWVADSGPNVSPNNSEFSDGANASQTYGTWGSCSHHNGSTTSGANATPLRKVQRPLNY